MVPPTEALRCGLPRIPILETVLQTPNRLRRGLYKSPKWQPSPRFRGHDVLKTQRLSSVFPFTKQSLETVWKVLGGVSSGSPGRRNGPLRPTFVATKRSSDAPKHCPGDFPDSLSRDCLENQDKVPSGLPRALKTGPTSANSPPWCHQIHALQSFLAIFQTVSMGTPDFSPTPGKAT
jgi:hypothetical protein